MPFYKVFIKEKESVNFIYSIGDTILVNVSELKDLGVTFTSNFNFNKHILNITSKGFKMLGFMRRMLKPFHEPDILITMYISLVRSQLEYCSIIWSPKANFMSNLIERVQRKFIKFLSYQLKLGCDVSYPTMCKRFKLLPLNQRRNISDLVLVNKFFNNKVDCSVLLEMFSFYVPQRRGRYTPCFYTKNRINIRKNSPMVRCQQLINETGLDFTEINLNVFKKKAIRVYEDK